MNHAGRVPRPSPAGRGTPEEHVGADTLVDHVGALVADLDGTCGVLERAGFTLTAAVPLLRPDPQGRMVPSGGWQRCLMFEQGYLEIQTVADPTTGHPLTARAQRYQGWHVLAFRTGDAEGFGRATRAVGLPVGDVQRWRRPTADGGEAEFSFVVVDPAHTPEALVIATEHHTPELVRPPGSTRHPNGTRALVEVLVTAADPAATSGRYRQLTGTPGTADGHGGVRFGTGPDTITVGSRDWLAGRCPAPPAGPDTLAAVVLAATDPAALTARLTEAGAVDLGERDGVRWSRVADTALLIGAVPTGSGPVHHRPLDAP